MCCLNMNLQKKSTECCANVLFFCFSIISYKYSTDISSSVMPHLLYYLYTLVNCLPYDPLGSVLVETSKLC